VAGVQALGLRVIAYRLEKREASAEFLNVTFQQDLAGLVAVPATPSLRFTPAMSLSSKKS